MCDRYKTSEQNLVEMYIHHILYMNATSSMLWRLLFVHSGKGNILHIQLQMHGPWWISAKFLFLWFLRVDQEAFQVETFSRMCLGDSKCYMIDVSCFFLHVMLKDHWSNPFLSLKTWPHLVHLYTNVIPVIREIVYWRRYRWPKILQNICVIIFSESVRISF